TAAEAFVGVRPALQRCRASVATGGANKTLRPASLKQKRRATRLVWKTRLEFAQRSCPCHWAPPRARRRWPAATPLYIIWGSLGQRDKPQTKRGTPVEDKRTITIDRKTMAFENKDVDKIGDDGTDSVEEYSGSCHIIAP